MVSLRQIPTIWNVADIGTYVVAKQRLYILMHESGLVYISTGENVGVDEFQRQSERSGNSSQTEKLAKMILRLSIAMGLEPVGAGRQCDVKDEEGHSRFSLAIFLLVTWFCGFRAGALEGLEDVEAQHRQHRDTAGPLWLCSRVQRTN